MPLTDEQKAAIKTLAGADPTEVADELQKEAQSHYQTVYQRGFSTSHTEGEKKIEAKDAEIKTLNETISTQKTDLEKLKEKTPDVKEIEQRYETRLTEKDNEIESTKKSANDRIVSIFKSSFKSDFKAELIALNVDPDYASEVLVNKYDDRIQVDIEKDEPTVKVLDKDGLTPLQATDGKLARLFAEKVKQDVDAKWIVSNADSGGGSDSSKNGSNTSSDWDKYRKRAKPEGEKPKEGTKARERLGMVDEH